MAAPKSTDQKQDIPDAKVQLALLREKTLALCGQRYKNAMGSIVKIRCENKIGEQSVGTGFFLQYGVVMTATHVVENATKIMLTTVDGMNLSITSPRILSLKSDVSVVLVLQETLPLGEQLILSHIQIIAPKITPNNPMLGERLFTIGFPLDCELPLLTNCIMAGFDENGRIAVDGSLNPGNSGGALYDKHGNVCGIVSSRPPAFHNTNAILPNLLHTINKMPSGIAHCVAAEDLWTMQQHLTRLLVQQRSFKPVDPKDGTSSTSAK